MSRRRPRGLLREGLDRHQAVLAWRAVEPHGALPECIEVYSDRSPWRLYALRGAGPAGSTVFAKCRRTSMAATERTVYERLLPGLPVATPRCYGCIDDGEYVWLLLQAVDGAPYDETNRDHLAMAARWLAAMHVESASLVGSTVLPDAGADRYLRHLIGGRAALERCLGNSRALDQVGRRTLAQLVDQLNDIEARWHSVRRRCATMPTVLVHGDFRPKNVFVQHDGTGLVAFDWETAGWGPPAADLTKVDVNEYWAAVRETWAAVGLATILEWAALGWVFQMLAAIDWKSSELAVDTAEALAPPLTSLQLWADRLAESLTL
jgi:aminoglycoside phosphotransferase (APT) family kinase protein